MRILLILVIVGTGLSGCTGTLEVLNADLKNASSASLEVIGAPGGYQVRNITVEKPSPLCSQADSSLLAEADAAFIAAVKDGYVETWNKSIAARKPALPRTVEQKARYSYYKSKEIKATQDIEENRHRYLHKAQNVQAQTSPYASRDQRERHLRAACIERAYSEGHMRGSTKAEEDVRAVISRAPPGT